MTSLNNLLSKEVQKFNISIGNISSLFERYFQQQDSAREEIDFAVKSISFYKETDLGTGASSFFTNVVVNRTGETKVPVDLRLGLEDGTAVDTTWLDTSSTYISWQNFEFRTNSPPQYAQLDPWKKIKTDRHYSNNSLLVNDFSLPVVKWVDRIFEFFQNVLLSSGVFV